MVLSQLLLLCWVMAATRVHATPFHHHHHPKGLIPVQTTWTLFRRCHRSPTATIATIKTLSSSWPSFLVLRGGGSVDTLNGDDDTTKTPTKEYQEEDTTTTQQPPQQDSGSPTPQEIEPLQSYRMQQQILLQLRATYLGEALARRGLPMTTVADVSTPEGASPPQPVDWDCALSTETNPMSCLFSFDAEPGTKVVAPLGTTQRDDCEETTVSPQEQQQQQQDCLKGNRDRNSSTTVGTMPWFRKARAVGLSSSSHSLVLSQLLLLRFSSHPSGRYWS